MAWGCGSFETESAPQLTDSAHTACLYSEDELLLILLDTYLSLAN